MQADHTLASSAPADQTRSRQGNTRQAKLAIHGGRRTVYGMFPTPWTRLKRAAVLSGDVLKMMPRIARGKTTIGDGSKIIKIALAAEGIQCVIEGEHQAGMTGALPIRLLVGDGDLQRAEEILYRHTDSDEDEEESDEEEG